MFENAFSGSINSHKDTKEYPFITMSVFSQALLLNAEFKSVQHFMLNSKID